MNSAIDSFLGTEVAVSDDINSPDLPSERLDEFIEFIDNVERIRQVRREWVNLELSFGTPLLTHNWFLSLADAIGSREQPEILLVRRGGEIKAIAPLAYRGRFQKRLEILGSSVTNEPGGVLYTDERSLEQLWETVCDMHVPVFLKGMRFGSPEIRALERAIRSRGIRSLVREERLPWVATKGKWEEFEKRLSSSRRSSFRRLQRLAESKGRVEFEVKVPGPESVDEYLSELFSVEASSWKGRTRTAMKSYEELGTFFRRYSRLEAGEGRLRIFFLKINGITVAGQLTAVHSNRLWIFKIGHDEAWSWCSPGILLMNRVIRYCFDSGLEGCEMLGSDESWLHIWADESHTVVTYRIYPRTLSAMLDLWTDAAGICSKKITTRLAKRRGRKRTDAQENAG